MRRAIVVALALLASPGCLHALTCRPGAGPTDCSFHFEGVNGGAHFASAWDATRVQAAMIAAGWSDAKIENGAVSAGPEAFHRDSVSAQPGMGAGWGFSIAYDEGHGPRELRSEAEARANASIERHRADFEPALARFEAALGEAHVGNLTWQPVIAIE